MATETTDSLYRRFILYEGLNVRINYSNNPHKYDTSSKQDSTQYHSMSCRSLLAWLIVLVRIITVIDTFCKPDLVAMFKT